MTGIKNPEFSYIFPSHESQSVLQTVGKTLSSSYSTNVLEVMYMQFAVNGVKQRKPLIFPYVTQIYFFCGVTSSVSSVNAFFPQYCSHVRGPVCSAAHIGPED